MNLEHLVSVGTVVLRCIRPCIHFNKPLLLTYSKYHLLMAGQIAERATFLEHESMSRPRRANVSLLEHLEGHFRSSQSS
jgi:hypothetical protein